MGGRLGRRHGATARLPGGRHRRRCAVRMLTDAPCLEGRGGRSTSIDAEGSEDGSQETPGSRLETRLESLVHVK